MAHLPSAIFFEEEPVQFNEELATVYAYFNKLLLNNYMEKMRRLLLIGLMGVILGTVLFFTSFVIHHQIGIVIGLLIFISGALFFSYNKFLRKSTPGINRIAKVYWRAKIVKHENLFFIIDKSGFFPETQFTYPYVSDGFQKLFKAKENIDSVLKKIPLVLDSNKPVAGSLNPELALHGQEALINEFLSDLDSYLKPGSSHSFSLNLLSSDTSIVQGIKKFSDHLVDNSETNNYLEKISNQEISDKLNILDIVKQNSEKEFNDKFNINLESLLKDVSANLSNNFEKFVLLRDNSFKYLEKHTIFNLLNDAWEKEFYFYCQNCSSIEEESYTPIETKNSLLKEFVPPLPEKKINRLPNKKALLVKTMDVGNWGNSVGASRQYLWKCQECGRTYSLDDKSVYRIPRIRIELEQLDSLWEHIKSSKDKAMKEIETSLQKDMKEYLEKLIAETTKTSQKHKEALKKIGGNLEQRQEMIYRLAAVGQMADTFQKHRLLSNRDNYGQLIEEAKKTAQQKIETLGQEIELYIKDLVKLPKDAGAFFEQLIQQSLIV